MVEDEFVAQFVDRAGGDARLHVRADHVQRLGRQPARHPHAGEILRRVDGDAPRVACSVHHAAPPAFRQSDQGPNMRKAPAGCKGRPPILPDALVRFSLGAC